MLNGDTTLWVHRACGARLKKQKPGNRNHQVKFIEQGLHNSAHTWQIRDMREVPINLNWNGTHSAVNLLLWCQEDLQLQWTVSTAAIFTTGTFRVLRKANMFTLGERRYSLLHCTLLLYLENVRASQDTSQSISSNRRTLKTVVKMLKFYLSCNSEWHRTGRIPT